MSVSIIRLALYSTKYSSTWAMREQYASKLVDYIGMQANELVARRCALRCWFTELNFTKISSSSLTFQCSQFVTQRRSFTWTNVTTRLYDLHPSTVRWRSSDCWQLHFEPGSARPLFIVTHYSLNLIIRTLFTDFFEVLLGDFITQNVLKTEITTFNSCEVPLQLISLVDALTLSVVIDATEEKYRIVLMWLQIRNVSVTYPHYHTGWHSNDRKYN